MNTNCQDPKVNCFVVSLAPVFDVLSSCVYSIDTTAHIDTREYVICAMRYIFDESPEVNKLLDRTECRTMLMNYGFTDEQMSWVEFNVLSMALMLMGDAHAYIRNLSMAGKVVGFYWDITQYRDLEIRVSYQ